MWRVPEHVSELPHSGQHSLFHFLALTRAYLEAHRERVRPEDLDLAAFFTVQTMQSLVHAAWIAFPERLKDGHLTDELTDLILRYLANDESDHARGSARLRPRRLGVPASRRSPGSSSPRS